MRQAIYMAGCVCAKSRVWKAWWVAPADSQAPTWVVVKTERSLACDCHGQKRLTLGKLIYCQLISMCNYSAEYTATLSSRRSLPWRPPWPKSYPLLSIQQDLKFACKYFLSSTIQTCPGGWTHVAGCLRTVHKWPWFWYHQILTCNVSQCKVG